MSTKRRVFQVARDFDISNEALIAFLAEADFDVRNHMSPLSDEMYEAASKKFGSKIQVVVEDVDIKEQLKQRKLIDEERKKKERHDYDEMIKISSIVMTEMPRRRKKSAPKEEDIFQKKEADEEESALPEAKTGKEKISTEIEASPLPDQPVEISVTPEKLETKAVEQPDESEEEKITHKEHFRTVKKVKATKERTEERAPVISQKETPFKKDLKSVPKLDIEKEPDAAEEGTVESAKKDVDLFHKIETRKKGIVTEEEDAATLHKKKKILKKKDRLTKPKVEAKKSEDRDISSIRKKKKKKKSERLAGAETADKKKRSKKKKKFVISDEEVEASIRQTFAAMEDAARHKKRRKRVKETGEFEEEEENLLRVNEFITIADLANEMDEEPSELIKKCLAMGMLVTINQRMDKEAIEILADEFGFKVEIIPEYGSDIIDELEEEEDDSDLQWRSPVVTIMGHVDHGKTSLLDFIRESNIIQGEAGGITQHIGAYQVNINSKMITFLDTPGHEAFTAMRARGAQATDIVILVVAADDSVMPQTIEAIDHAKAAGVPIIVAINKIDKSNANPELIKKQLSERSVLIEEWGGKYQCVEISAKTGIGIEKLLESIIIESEMLELKANPNRLAKGVVIESKLDRGKGVVVTVLVQKGTLKVGDPFIVGQYYGKVRGLFDEKGKKRKDAGPSVPVQVIGFTGLPQAGDKFTVLESERDTREISLERQQVKREQEYRHIRHLTLDEISRQIKSGKVKELSLVIKGDVDGSVEALSDSLLKLSTAEVTLNIIRKGVGAISESDVLLASTSDAIIIGFQVRPTIKAREIASRENIDIRMYKVIYDVLSDVKDALEGLLEPTLEEINLGTVEVRETFKVPKIGTIAGCYVLTGKVTRNDMIRLYREDKLTYEGKLNSLRRFKDDAREVAAGFECGIGLENFDDIKVGDVLETYEIIQVKRKLEK
ncbi:MAG: translation initiation factor IF-2 [Candidatus Zhuqueibacterota bacterium]